MAENSSIEWLKGGSTWNPIRAELLEDIVRAGNVVAHKGDIGWFCIKCSPGCAGCYACAMNLWRGNGLEYTIPNLNKVRMFLDEKTLLHPLRWKRRRLIFPCSMTDWMEPKLVPDEWIDKMLAVIALTPHTYLTLTKRVNRQRGYFKINSTGGHIFHVASAIRDMVGIKRLMSGSWPLPNLWLGISAENQQYADERIPELLQTPAAVRWVSAEPLLGAIDCTPYVSRSGPYEHVELPPLDWVVAGGESGPKARPMHPDWVRPIRDQCVAAGVSFFFKQWGEWASVLGEPHPGDIVVHHDPYHIANRVIDGKPERFAEWNRDLHGGADGTLLRAGWQIMRKVGKKAAGRLLDGREWNEYPNA